MAIPLATTSISVRRSPAADDYAEPYSGTSTAGFDEVATGVPAVIYAPTGREAVAGGEQTVTELRFVCDLTDLKTTDFLVDDTTGVTYRVTWCVVYAGEHIEGAIKQVEGLV
jgi:hypothetical protein